MASFLRSTASSLKGTESQTLGDCLPFLPQFPLCKVGGASGPVEYVVPSLSLPWRVRRPVLLVNLSQRALPLSRTLWEADLMPHRPLLESLASSTYGTVSSGHRRSSTSPTAPRTCQATSSHGWTTTSMCSEGLPSGLWRPVKSGSWTCSCLLLPRGHIPSGCLGTSRHLFPIHLKPLA